MKKLFLLMMTTVLLAAFTNDTKMTANPVNAKELKGYLVRDSNISLNDYNLWVITHEQAFDKMFEAADLSAPRPVFDKELVLAVKVETYSNSYKVQFARVIQHRHELNIYFSIQRDKVKLETGRPVAMVAVEKDPSIRKVNFYHGNALVRSIPIVTVY